MGIDKDNLEKAMQVQKGLMQFDNLHQPKIEKSQDREVLVCPTCDVDFPCERMLLFMILQGIASFKAMIPSGNPAEIMQRFMRGNA